MNKTIKKAICAALAAFTVCSSLVLASQKVRAAYDGEINQSVDHSNEESMYRYDIDIQLTNPCNTNDMDDDAVCELWFDITYKSENGYGASKTYRFDMSWKNGRNLNNDILKNNFLRPNDNECQTGFSLWIPGIVEKVKIHLNMDGGERLAFTVNGIFLNGYRVNAGTDYVSSAYYDSNAEIKCHAANAGIVHTDGNAARDQYNGLFTAKNTQNAIARADIGDYKYYHKYKRDNGERK